MRFRQIVLIVVAAVAQVVAWGQAPAGPTDLQLLERPDVQADLQFNSGQKSRLDEVRLKVTRQWEGGSKHHETIATSRFQIQEMLAQANRQANAIMTEEQRKRLAEIKFQLRGNLVFLDPAVQKQFDITDTQKAQISSIQERQQAQTRQSVRNGDFQYKKLSMVLQNSQARFNADIEKLLTPEQTAKLKLLRGKPFHSQG